ncbi:MAG: hypothetical protein H6727_05165 [Myxococcales bacterium]|nr:hypothetical protein [Myxococcales bacterium]
MLTATTPASDVVPQAVLTRAQMRAFFEQAYKPREKWRVGFEYEMSGVLKEDLSPLPFRGPRSIEYITRHLRDRYGEKDASVEDGYYYGFTLPHGNFSLEPGGQVEFSSNPCATTEEMEAALGRFLQDVCSLGEEIDVQFYIAGVNPFQDVKEMPWSQKGRYKIMREYLIKQGRFAHHMMQQTMSLQFNIDYADEADAVRKYMAGIRLYPTIEFLTYNSFIYNGEILAEPFRPKIWTEMDPDRSGLPPAIHSFDDYIEYVLDVPIFFLMRAGEVVTVADGTTFRQFMEGGYKGHTATYADWTLHLSTLFPEVRFKKNALELRMFDGNQPDMLLAHATLVRSIFYHAEALEQIEQQSFDRSWEAAERLLQIAKQFTPEEEQHYLLPLFKEVEQRQQPGLLAAEHYRQNNQDRRALLDYLRIC